MHTAEATPLARLWTTLEEIKTGIDNTALPLGTHLGIEDPELMAALEELSAKIDGHFQRFKLVAVLRETPR